MLKQFLTTILTALARAIVRKYRPKVVGITGSVGKTTTRAACVAVLSQRYRVRGSSKNYNNEIGVPITIIGVDAPGSSVLKWLNAFGKGLALLIGTDALYPQVLVLEMGADHPGDLKHLMSIAPLDVGVVTAVSPAHTEFFETVEGVLAEKKTVVVSLDKTKKAVINADDARLATIHGEIAAELFTFGFSDDARVRARDAQVRYGTSGLPEGMEAELVIDGEEMGFGIPGVLGRPVVYAAAAAVAVGLACYMKPHLIQFGLAQIEAPAGRMRLIRGIKNTVLIDDTYNASPRAAEEAIGILRSLHAHHRRIAVLGDMLELGKLTETEHRRVGALVAAAGIDVLIVVGPASRYTAEEARNAGMGEDRVFAFDNAREAGQFLQERMKEGDVILVKGSQGVRMERVVREVMAEPMRAGELLVRQSGEWV